MRNFLCAKATRELATQNFAYLPASPPARQMNSNEDRDLLHQAAHEKLLLQSGWGNLSNALITNKRCNIFILIAEYKFQSYIRPIDVQIVERRLLALLELLHVGERTVFRRDMPEYVEKSDIDLLSALAVGHNISSSDPQ